MKRIELPYDGFVEVYSPEEGVNCIIEECCGKPAVTKGRKNPLTYYQQFATFDIETTKLPNDNWHKKIPEKFHYFNYTFCWQFKIGKYFIFGREAEEFFRMLDAAAEQLDAMLIIFIHNAAYEVNNLADFFFRERYRDGFFRNSSTPLYIRFDKYEFRCTAQLTHKSLAQLGNDIRYQKLKDDFDYNRIISPRDELSPMDINYCYRDVEILQRWLNQEIPSYCASIGKRQECACWLPLTQTGYVRYDMQRGFSNTEAGHYILEHTALTQREYETIRPAFFGGYVHANFRHVGEVITEPFLHVDIISAYPTWMCNGLFMYHLTEVLAPDVNDYLKNLTKERFGQIGDFDLVGVTLKKGHVPYIPYIEGNSKVVGSGVVEENGKIVHADAVRITVCDIDMRLILANYNVKAMRINKLYIGKKKPLPYAVIDQVLHYYEKKTALKGVHSEDGSIEYEYGLNKQKQNSCYGMAAQDLMNNTFSVDPELLDVIQGAAEYKESKTLPYQWALQITAMVRSVIYGFITFLTTHADEGNIFYYSDTDSVFCKDTLSAREYIRKYNEMMLEKQRKLSLKFFNAIPKNKKGEEKPLGLLDLEEDCLDAKEFCTIGAKRYYVMHDDGTVDITFSGLRATKTWIDSEHKRHNGANTERLIEKYGSVGKAFQTIMKKDVELPYREGIDKLSNYNVRGDFVNRSAFGYEVRRPCTYTLYGMGTKLSLNTSLAEWLASQEYDLYL